MSRSLVVPWPAPMRETQLWAGQGLLEHINVPERQVALLHDAQLPTTWVQQAEYALRPLVTLPVSSGETGKTLPEAARLLSRLSEAGMTRSGAVAAIGGGATTDLAGFVAATYLRGVPFYAMPTTLLGMVDAALGGKTGVNLPQGKNLAGAFWPARAVWCDTATLSTLPEREFRAGAAEVFKHGLLTPLQEGDDGSRSLMAQVLPTQAHRGGLTAQRTDLADVVMTAAAIKAAVVTRDPTEQGERAFLNLGHTLAHALETATGHALPHGEAVGYGMHFAALLSEGLGARGLAPYTRAFLQWQRPVPLPAFKLTELWPLMSRDKKADAQGIRWVLLRRIGQPYSTRVAGPTLAEAFAQWQHDLAALGLMQR